MFLGDYVSTIDVGGQKVLKVDPKALTTLSEQAFIDIAHLLRPAHLQVCSVYRILRNKRACLNKRAPNF